MLDRTEYQQQRFNPFDRQVNVPVAATDADAEPSFWTRFMRQVPMFLQCFEHRINRFLFSFCVAFSMQMSPPPITLCQTMQLKTKAVALKHHHTATIR